MANLRNRVILTGLSLADIDVIDSRYLIIIFNYYILLLVVGLFSYQEKKMHNLFFCIKGMKHAIAENSWLYKYF